MSDRLTARPPVVAGIFYPAHPGTLAAHVDWLLTGARTAKDAPPKHTSLRDRRPLAIVVPHAALDYSGPVAATAYSALRGCAPDIARVILIGPAHSVPVVAMAVPAASSFDTPLGQVLVDAGARAKISSARPDDVVVDDAPHAPEHSLEVQLPFLQRALRHSWSAVPILVGGAPANAVADVLDALWASDTLVVVSTDLSHYLDHTTAQRRDRATADAVVGCRAGAIGARDACGAYPLKGLLAWASRHSRAVSLLDLRTSADTVGDPARVVGYGAFRVD